MEGENRDRALLRPDILPLNDVTGSSISQRWRCGQTLGQALAIWERSITASVAAQRCFFFFVKKWSLERLFSHT